MIVNQSNLTGIYRSFSTVFNQAFDGAPSYWQAVAMQVPSEGRSVDYKWLGDFPIFREWVGDRLIKDISAFRYEIVNKDYEATIEVDRNDIEDDQIGVYTPMIQGLAWAARQVLGDSMLAVIADSASLARTQLQDAVRREVRAFVGGHKGAAERRGCGFGKCRGVRVSGSRHRSGRDDRD